MRERGEKPTALVLAGGVGANQAVRKILHKVATEGGTRLAVPPPELCTDNGAMIAWAGAERLALGRKDSLEFAPARPLAAGGDRPGRRGAAGLMASPDPHRRRDRCRRLGHGARQCRGAGRADGVPVGAQSRSRRRDAHAAAATMLHLPGVTLAATVRPTIDLGEAAACRGCPAGGAGAGAAATPRRCWRPICAAARRSSPAPRASSAARIAVHDAGDRGRPARRRYPPCSPAPASRRTSPPACRPR